MNKTTGNLFVIAAPSGTGKTSLVKALVESTPTLSVSVSHTTRPKRPGETDGINYHFVTEKEFHQMIEHGDFLEHATIFKNLYGTSRKWVAEKLEQGIDVILEIDWQGSQQIKKLFPDSISIFILPPSMEALSERLHKRNQDKPEIITQRLADVRIAIQHVPEFDYVVMNEDFDHALVDLKTIVAASRLRQKRQCQKFAGQLKNLV